MIMAAVDGTREAEVAVKGECDVARARIAAKRLATDLGMRRDAIYRLATAVTELASNLVFHTTDGGVIRLTTIVETDRQGVEVAAEDHGPGLADIGLAMTDGYSSNGGLGGGLPGCKRLMDEFEISSRPGKGTLVVARLWR